MAWEEIPLTTNKYTILAERDDTDGGLTGRLAVVCDPRGVINAARMLNDPDDHFAFPPKSD